MADNILPDDYSGFDDGDTLVMGGSEFEDGNYDELLSDLDTPVDESTPPEGDTPPASQSSTETPSGEAATTTDTSDWEEAPAPIADWQTRSQQENVPATSEAQFRENLSLRQYVQDQFARDGATQQLYQLADESTPAKARISRYVAERIKEPYETVTDADVLARVEGAMTDYFDDDSELTPKGKKLDDHLKAQYALSLNQKVAEWESAGRTDLANQKLFTTALQTQLSAVEGLKPDEQREAYQFIRKGQLSRIVDGLDEQGKPLPPAEIAKAQADAALWSNPKTRKILLDKEKAAEYQRGRSDGLKGA